ncbi:hypothetical protein VTN96DRAFT_9165 [Rasamsonia emersonii]
MWTSSTTIVATHQLVAFVAAGMARWPANEEAGLRISIGERVHRILVYGLEVQSTPYSTGISHETVELEWSCT